MQLPYIPEDAPFSGEQRSWLAGFLAGLHSRKVLGGAVSAAPVAQAAPPLDILYGTQTGNAETVAEEAAGLARMRGYQPRVAELDSVSIAGLAAMKEVVIVVSTYGEGEMPDNAHQFWEALSAEGVPRMEHLRFAVLGLGDTSYEYFCQAAKLIDTRLEQLGAQRIGPRLDCDVDFEDAAASWLDGTLPTATNGTTTPANDDHLVPQKTGWTRKSPYGARLLENRLLSGEKSAKEIRHFSFDLADSGISYEAGDALGVMPVNSDALVQALLTRLGARPDSAVPGRDQALGQLLRTGLEIRTPSKDLIGAIAARAGHDELSHVVANGDKEALDAFLWGRDVLDLMNLAPELQFDLEEWLGWMKPLQHRAYSISSSPNAHPGEVHLTVAAVRWMFEGRPHGGVCSTWLSDDTAPGSTAPIFLSPNRSFRVPQDDSLPMIMVGPGTGIAPFRAFLQERQARGASGTNWLFFGDQHRASDFIYEEEISAMSASGLLTRLDLAFSRDQADKIYVQNRMEQNGKALFAMLEEGGHFYVCGDATRMARDVDAALHRIIAEHGGRSGEAATDYVNALKRDKRYLRDVY